MTVSLTPYQEGLLNEIPIRQVREQVRAVMVAGSNAEAENERLRAAIVGLRDEAVRQIQGTVDDMLAVGERAIKKAVEGVNEELVQPLLAERDSLQARLEAVRAARDEIEARRMHIPPSDHPDRMKAIVQRSTSNQALRRIDAALSVAPQPEPGPQR